MGGWETSRTKERRGGSGGGVYLCLRNMYLVSGVGMAQRLNNPAG